MAESEWVVDTTDGTFEADVFARSELGLVLVDFWAEWCQPCRMLAPILEKLADEAAGRFTLVKANTDENPEAAGQFQVRGIPAVFAVVDRQVVDGFNAALPEPEIRAWLDRLYPVVDVSAAKKLAETDPAAAEEKLRAIVADGEGEVKVFAQIALAELLLNQDKLDECQEIISELEERGYLEPEAEKLKATLAIKNRGGSDTDIDALRATSSSEPENLDAQFALAEALVGQQTYEEAFDICLVLVENDRQGTGEKARALMVEVFQSLPADSELVTEYRRKLSMLLY